MSHLSKIKTSLKNLNYLEKSLKKLDLEYKILDELDSTLPKVIIYQNKTNIEFIWNGNEFELITDLSFWEQRLSIDEFLKNLIKEYTYEAIFNETKTLGFSKVKEENNVVLLERWI